MILKPSIKSVKVKRHKNLVTDGPFAGEYLTLCSPGTACFKLGNWHGYYDIKNRWVPV